jgi:hypothetical protein
MNVVIEIDDAVSIDKIIETLGPYIKKASIKDCPKLFNGKTSWQGGHFKVDSFTPLSRDEIHDRKNFH